MTDAEYKRLTDALEHVKPFIDRSYYTNKPSDVMMDAAKLEIVYNYAEKYAALLPRLAELVEAREKATVKVAAFDNYLEGDDELIAKFYSDNPIAGDSSNDTYFIEQCYSTITQIAEIIKGAE